MARGASKPWKREKSVSPHNLHPDHADTQIRSGQDAIVWGRFSKEESATLRNAILDYFKTKGWRENEGVSKILNCRKHKEARGCWDVIRQCLPHRPREAVIKHCYLMLEQNEGLGKWSKEEKATLLRLQQEHGNQWRKLSYTLNRGRFSIRLQSRHLKVQSAKGPWTQDELRKLFELAHNHLQQKALKESVSNQNDHRHLRDNINWDLIAGKLGTRNFSACSQKWYGFLSSSLAASGQWSDADDILLLKRLLECGACSEEEVEWDLLLAHRCGQVCQTRWKQMANHLGRKRTRLFLEDLDLLVQRYAPQLLEMGASSQGEAGQ